MDYWHKLWVCPFYRWSDKTRVHCEGGTGVAFHDIRTIVEYMEGYCASQNWKQCSIAKSMLTYYERRDEIEENDQEPRKPE